MFNKALKFLQSTLPTDTLPTFHAILYTGVSSSHFEEHAASIFRVPLKCPDQTRHTTWYKNPEHYK